MKEGVTYFGFSPIFHPTPTVYHIEKAMSTQNNKFFAKFLNFFVLECCFVLFYTKIFKILVIFVVFY